jgi:hypothetical protein
MSLELFNGMQPCIYGDSAYAASPVMKKAGLDVVMNARMGSYRIMVEQSFGKMKQMWQFINYARNLRLLVHDVQLLIKCAALLTNFHTALTGISAASATGGVQPPSLEEYLHDVSLLSMVVFVHICYVYCACLTSVDGGGDVAVKPRPRRELKAHL